MIRRRAGLAGVLGLAGCGFRPVYGPLAASRGALPRIDVERIGERDGQMMREALQARLPDSGRTPARYGLQVDYGVTADVEGILADSTATRVRLTGRAIYALMDRDTGLVVQRGTARALDGLDVVDQQLLAADFGAERVHTRLAGVLADQIVTQIAARLRG